METLLGKNVLLYWGLHQHFSGKLFVILHLSIANLWILLLIFLSLSWSSYNLLFFVLFTSRFGSFEIFKPTDSMTGRKGPSVDRTDILVQLLDYTVKTFFPQVTNTFKFLHIMQYLELNVHSICRARHTAYRVKNSHEAVE